MINMHPESLNKDPAVCNGSNQFPIPRMRCACRESWYCIHHLGLVICFDEYHYHDSLQACLIKGIGHYSQVLKGKERKI